MKEVFFRTLVEVGGGGGDNTRPYFNYFTVVFVVVEESFEVHLEFAWVVLMIDYMKEELFFFYCLPTKLLFGA